MSFKRRLAALDPSIYSSIKRKAELGLLQPCLGVELISELWAEDTENSKEGYIELTGVPIFNRIISLIISIMSSLRKILCSLLFGKSSAKR